jgi:hypothetical protein
MMRLSQDDFEDLAEEVSFCVENLKDPRCTIDVAGRFYEKAAESLRAHAILRLLIDADGDGFANDLVMSGQARRAFLRRCAREKYADYYLAFSRSGSMLDAMAGDDFALAEEIFSLSPTRYRKGDEYEDDFCWQRFLGLHLSGAPSRQLDESLTRLEAASDGAGAKLAVARALHAKDRSAFEDAFRDLLGERQEEVAEDPTAEEEVVAAAGTKVFVEGVAVLKLARRAKLKIAKEYPMCPILALRPHKAATPEDEFAVP